MLATVSNMGTRNTDMGKNRVLLLRMSILSGKTHINQAQQNSVVSVLWSGASAPHRNGETDSAVVVGGPGRPHTERSGHLCCTSQVKRRGQLTVSIIPSLSLVSH